MAEPGQGYLYAFVAAGQGGGRSEETGGGESATGDPEVGAEGGRA